MKYSRRRRHLSSQTRSISTRQRYYTLREPQNPFVLGLHAVALHSQERKEWKYYSMVVDAMLNGEASPKHTVQQTTLERVSDTLERRLDKRQVKDR